MPHQPNNLAPKTSTPRPPLPYSHANPFLSLVDTSKTPAVKYQVITREGQEIVVGRVKIQTPGGGHAFVLRRFDTGAISLTTMFRAAFPTAPDESEKVEASWVKANYDSYGANGSGRDASSKLRLAGTWVHPEVAKTVAPMYNLEHVISPLTNAEPDPGQEYRRSTKPASPQVNVNGSPAKVAAGPRIEVAAPASPTPAGGRESKRRKESSPVVASASVDALSLPSRRSGRTASPAAIPASQSQPVAATAMRASRSKAAKAPRTALKQLANTNGKAVSRLTPAESDHAHPDDDDEGDGEIAEVPGPDMHEDIAEQKEMIAKLKAERESSIKTSEEGSLSGRVAAVPIQKTESQISKRSREEEDQPLQFQFREPGQETDIATRPIASNRRLSLDLDPQQRSAAWGVLFFAAAAAATAAIPSFFM